MISSIYIYICVYMYIFNLLSFKCLRTLCCNRRRNSFLILIRKICRSRGWLAAASPVAFCSLNKNIRVMWTGNWQQWTLGSAVASEEAEAAPFGIPRQITSFFPLPLPSYPPSVLRAPVRPARMDRILIALLPACGSASLYPPSLLSPFLFLFLYFPPLFFFLIRHKEILS